jgi:predicted transcriptional regulator|tara:strand:- start:3463 stop:3681 length:219 start_codon:yes stop_codon:yes gene_type:complete
MTTTIQISGELQSKLSQKKMFDKETYEEVIWDLLEDSMELAEETKRSIEISKKEIKEGKTVTLEQVKKELRL